LVNTESGIRNRGIVRLPPGSGKTRIVIDALIKYWKKRSSGKVRFILWIAQTEELCEQAFQSFKQAWAVEGETEQKLRLFRMWGAERVLPNLDQEGIIVAGIDKLFSGIRNNDEISEFQTGLESLGAYMGIIIVDEAHTSITRKYNTVFNTLGINFPSSSGHEIPLIGLTATPFRGYDQDDTKYLLERYNSNILYPRGNGFDPAIWSNWKHLKKELIDRRVLSKPIHLPIPTDRNFDVDYHDFVESPRGMEKLLDDISSDFERNRIIFNTLLDLSKEKKSIIYFAPSVTNANIMAALLRDRGVSSGVVSSATGSGIRQMYIKKFKEQEIKILCNFGVLTTGFDSPLIDAVMIARPTNSPNLYEQMIGRGMRGPEFGGTEECLILDLLDNIYIHQIGRKYRFHDRSLDFWNSMEFEN
jgi:superfamily II DNA or RNA helicase